LKLQGLALSLCLVGSTLAFAQNSNPPDAPKPQHTEHQKFFSFSPSLSVANDTLPMSAGEKFELFARNTVNPFQFVATAAAAGIAQADDRFHTWGQGADGYGKRYGASYADLASSNFFSTFFFPAILHQDPRYFRKESGTFGSRLKYAITRVAVTRTDSGHSAPNASLWMGSLAAGGIINLYAPTADQGVGLTFEGAGVDIASAAGFNVAREFWPDVSHHLFHHKK